MSLLKHRNTSRHGDTYQYSQHLTEAGSNLLHSELQASLGYKTLMNLTPKPVNFNLKSQSTELVPEDTA